MGLERGIDKPLNERKLHELLKFFTKKTKAIKQTMLKHHSLFRNGIRKRFAIIKESRNIELDQDYPCSFDS